MAKYGYARALQNGQSLNKQIQIFAQFGVPKENIFVDEQPGMRNAYGQLLQLLKKGDLLVIKNLNCLGDGYGSIATEWMRVSETLSADICVADMPALDTRLGSNGEVISSVVIQILNFCDERAKKQSALQAKGVQSAKQRGVKFGRPTKKYSDEFIVTVARFRAKDITLEEALRITNMKQSSFYYHVHRIVETGLLPDKNVAH